MSQVDSFLLHRQFQNTYPLFYFWFVPVCFVFRWSDEEAVRGRWCLGVIRYILLLPHRHFVFRWFDLDITQVHGFIMYQWLRFDSFAGMWLGIRSRKCRYWLGRIMRRERLRWRWKRWRYDSQSKYIVDRFKQFWCLFGVYSKSFFTLFWSLNWKCYQCVI